MQQTIDSLSADSILGAVCLEREGARSEKRLTEVAVPPLPVVGGGTALGLAV